MPRWRDRTYTSVPAWVLADRNDGHKTHKTLKRCEVSGDREELGSVRAKWLEAACYMLVIAPDSDLARKVEEAVDNIRDAQHEDGYINTYYTVGDDRGSRIALTVSQVVEPDKRWTNLS